MISLTFPPDGVSTAHLMGELAADLRAAGHDIVVLTTTPHYNKDETARSSQPLRWLVGPLLKTSVYSGAKVFHIWMPPKRGNIVVRGFFWLGFHVWSVIIGAFLSRKSDAIFTISPPITIGVVAWMLSVVGSNRYIYNVQEIYPDVAIELGILRNKFIIGILKWVEGFVYKKAYAITVISKGMAEKLRSKGVPQSKILLLPNWVDTGSMLPMSKDNDFSRGNGLVDKFVVSYAGNIGPTQRLELLLDAAGALKGRAEIRFLIVGGGSFEKELRSIAAKNELTNVTIMGYQPYEMVPAIYAASDLCFVPQIAGIGADAIPSKVYRIMAAAKPVLCLAKADSDLARLVADAGAGFNVEAEEGNILAQVIEHAQKDDAKLREAGTKGREYVQRIYERAVITGRYEDLLREAAT